MNQMSSVETLARNGKSFYFAGLFLPQRQLHIIAELYSFCRYVDDSADELAPDLAKKEIERIKAALRKGDDANLNKAISRLEYHGVKREHLVDLVTGADWDINKILIQNEQQLDLYCYHVAGVVGLMMNPLMKVKNTDANHYAMSLGKAMQLTNICRDVLEDALNERTYLPLEELQNAKINLQILRRQGATPNELKLLVAKYLTKAEGLYQEGYRGLGYIPLRCRFVILLAGELYRHIGVKIARNDYEVLKGRTYLGTPEKVWVSVKTAFKLFRPRFWMKPKARTGEDFA